MFASSVRGFNHAVLFRAVAEAVGDRTAVVGGSRRQTFAQTADRIHRLANVFLDHGLTIHEPRSDLAPWESGQDHIALYLYNGPEFIEASLAAAEARAVAFNVNYRYVADELAYLLNDAQAGAVVYHAVFAPVLAEVLPRLRGLRRGVVLIQVADESGNALLDGAVDYEDALAASSGASPATEPSPEDLYLVYTGGTTGMPKGTLWTQANLFDANFAAGLPPEVTDRSSPEAVARGVADAAPWSVLPMSPMMHGAAHWLALVTLLSGAAVVFPDAVDRLDAPSVLRAIEAERVRTTNIIGDAFARPLLDELETGAYDVSSLEFLVNGGATLTPRSKRRLLRSLPGITLIDGAGASESGTHLSKVAVGEDDAETVGFVPTPDTCIVDESLSRVLEPGHEGAGWLARQGPIPLGYLGDQAKTERTFPVVAGVRMSIPGDRAKLRADGLVELLGRDSVTINSGGEKIFAEEVEQALLASESVADALVVGRPSERWGQEVVAVVQSADGAAGDDEALLLAASARIARYKLPKAVVWVDRIQRGPAGKADYAWAREVAAR